MRARAQITLLASLAAISLGIGIPVFALTVKPSTHLLQGTVVSVAPGEHTVLVHSDDGNGNPGGHNVLVRLTAGQQVKIKHGTEDPRLLLPGQSVTAQIHRGTFNAESIALTDPPTRPHP